MVKQLLAIRSLKKMINQMNIAKTFHKVKELFTTTEQKTCLKHS